MFTLAPIWLPHWPACKCKISLMTMRCASYSSVVVVVVETIYYCCRRCRPPTVVVRVRLAVCTLRLPLRSATAHRRAPPDTATPRAATDHRGESLHHGDGWRGGGRQRWGGNHRTHASTAYTQTHRHRVSRHPSPPRTTRRIFFPAFPPPRRNGFFRIRFFGGETTENVSLDQHDSQHPAVEYIII